MEAGDQNKDEEGNYYYMHRGYYPRGYSSYGYGYPHHSYWYGQQADNEQPEDNKS